MTTSEDNTAEKAVTTAEIRASYAWTGGYAPYQPLEDEFDRWLATHDAEVRAEALREAKEAIENTEGGPQDFWGLELAADVLAALAEGTPERGNR